MDSFLKDSLILFFKFFGVISFLYVLITYCLRSYTDFGQIRSTWHQLLPNQQFSIQEFYQRIEDAVKESRISQVIVTHKKYPQVNVFMASREYLRLAWDDQMVLICAAPFGTHYFVSWRDGRWLNFFEDLIPRLPLIGKRLAEFLFSKTYYQIDTQNMFVETVRRAFDEVLAGMGEHKAHRPL